MHTNAMLAPRASNVAPMGLRDAAAQPGWFKREEAIMGTAIVVELWASDARRARAAIDAVMAEMHRIDHAMSPHKPHSELSCINRDAGQQPVRLSDEMYALIERAIAFSALSHGAFDITYASAGQLYDYRHAVQPSADALARACQAIGWRGLRLDPQARTLAFAHPGMRIDLGGFAKGHAVDNATALLRRHGITHALGQRRRRQPRHRRPPRPPLDIGCAPSAPGQWPGGAAAADRHRGLDLGRLRTLLRARRRAPPPHHRPGHRPLARRYPQRDDPGRRRPDGRGPVQEPVRARRRARHGAHRISARHRRRRRRRRRANCITRPDCWPRKGPEQSRQQVTVIDR